MSARRTATFVDVYHRVAEREAGPAISIEQACRRLSNVGLSPLQVGHVLALVAQETEDTRELAEELGVSDVDRLSGAWMMGLLTGIEWERERRRS